MKTILLIIGGIVLINVLFVIFALVKASGDDERKRENEKDNSDL